MGVTIRKRGNGHWLMTVHWRKQRVTKTFKIKRVAEAVAAEIEQRLARADLANFEDSTDLRALLRDTAIEPLRRSEVPTFGEYAPQWLHDKADVWAHGTEAIRETIVRKHLMPDLGNRRLDEIGAPAIRSLLRAKKKAKMSASSLRGMLATISGLYKSAMRDHPSIGQNPARGAGEGIVPGRKKGEVPRAWDGEQRTRLVRQLKEVRDANVRELLLFLDSTGARVGEALALTWADIDTERGEAIIMRTYTRRVLDSPKTDTSSRSIIVPEATVKRLCALRVRNDRAALAGGVGASDVVFQGEGALGRVREWHYRDVLKRACRRAGVTAWSVHSLRHSYATRLLGNGAPSDLVKSQLGHSSIRVTHDLYSHALKGDLPNRRKWLDPASDATAARLSEDAKS